MVPIKGRNRDTPSPLPMFSKAERTPWHICMYHGRCLGVSICWSLSRVFPWLFSPKCSYSYFKGLNLAWPRLGKIIFHLFSPLLPVANKADRRIFVTSLINDSLGLLICKLALYTQHNKRPKKEGRPPQIGGWQFNKQGNLLGLSQVVARPVDLCPLLPES